MSGFVEERFRYRSLRVLSEKRLTAELCADPSEDMYRERLSQRLWRWEKKGEAAGRSGGEATVEKISLVEMIGK